MRSAKLRGWANTAPTQIGLKTASDQQASADGATSIPTTRHILQHVGREVRRTSLVSLSIPRPRHVLRTRRAPSHAPSPLTLASSRSSSRQRRKSRASTCPKRCVRSFSRLSFGSELTHGPLGRVVAQVQKVAIEVATTAMGAHDIEKDVRGLRTRWRAGGGVGTTR